MKGTVRKSVRCNAGIYFVASDLSIRYRGPMIPRLSVRSGVGGDIQRIGDTLCGSESGMFDSRLD